MKEFNLRERAEIVTLAIGCSKSLSAQELIDYFNGVYITQSTHGTTIGNAIVNKYFPDSNEVFRRTIIQMMTEYAFSFEHIIGNEVKQDIAKQKVADILKKYLGEEKEYLYYDKGMYPNFVTKDVLINLIVNDLFHQEKEKSCTCGMSGDDSGLDKDGCCCTGTSCKK